MEIKDDVILSGLDLRMRQALITADKLWKKYGQELVLTCGLDGTHSAGSLHYYGLAIDCRIRYFTKEEIQSVFRELKQMLGSGFEVILHKSHIHIEANI